MDDIVRQAMAKWPSVPDCFGWLGLDARGNWYLRDDRAQALGGFASGVPGCKGSMLTHGKLIEFIGRNYAADASGRWFFQNGPQRVFVELAATPLVWRIQPDQSVQDHIGRPALVQQCLVDELGHLYLLADTGFGLVHSQDVGLAADALESGCWHLQQVLRASLALRFAYVASPQSLQEKALPGPAA